MKKLIAILTIAIVLVGAVFAADSTGSASLTVQTKINGGEPVFKLATDTVSVDLATGGATGTTAHTITADALLSADQTVTFLVVQTNKSRSTKTYTLTATASDLVLYQYPDPTDPTQNILCSTTAHPAAESYKKFTIQGGTTVATLTGNDAQETPAPYIPAAKATYAGNGSASLSITYKGNAFGAANTDSTVARFTCTWDDNEDAVAGDYQATVTLTISSN